MANQLRLERLPSDRPEEAVCLLCDEFFEPAGELSILHDGDIPLGYLCVRCAGIQSTAVKRVRQRAQRIRVLWENDPPDEPPKRLRKKLELIYRRVAHWLALADKIERLDSWG